MTTVALTLTDFLLARIAEDEARAPRKREDYYDKPCPQCGHPVSGLRSPLDDEATRALHPNDPSGLGCALSMEQWNALMPDLGPSPEGARVLADCEAKRRTLDVAQLFGCRNAVARYLALPYAAHPDYREEWRP